ncbi:hypothetical protein [Kitasatospora sp. NPDC017646]|uniref:hypothetical protein n=1 Tax=Kitasatospora sp. NPDC017646 TaxID=3364024 RepID=UPI0037BD00F3
MRAALSTALTPATATPAGVVPAAAPAQARGTDPSITFGFTGATVGAGGTGGNNTGGNCVAAGAGGGGGGGYFGGGGGGASTHGSSGLGRAGGGGGGGGSSLAVPSGTGTTYTASTIGTANHNGQVTISYTVVTPTQAITQTHNEKFVQGGQGTYTITVDNNGPGATDGTTVTVYDTLPSGLRVRDISGPGWTCTRDILTCTRNDVLPAGSSYPPITLHVTVSCDCDEHHRLTNRATVTGGGDPTAHTATDPTSIKRGEYCHHDDD